jgi:hypothetical protein
MSDTGKLDFDVAAVVVRPGKWMDDGLTDEVGVDGTKMVLNICLCTEVGEEVDFKVGAVVNELYPEAEEVEVGETDVEVTRSARKLDSRVRIALGDAVERSVAGNAKEVSFCG